MNPWDTFPGAGDHPSPIRRQLQGPRPTPLKVHKDSHKIKKPPVAPPPKPPLPPPDPAAEPRQPVIIYAVSPKVIHTTENEFMNLVQRLTGASSSTTYYSPASTSSAVAGGDVSPAARLASIERTSPFERGRRAGENMGTIEGFEIGQFPGILSPAPGSLPPIQPGLFSPGYDFSMLNDLSPYLSNMFTPSPSSLLSAPLVSPSPSSFDLLNQLFDF